MGVRLGAYLPLLGLEPSRKAKEEYLYSAIYTTHSLKVLRHGSHSFYLQITLCLPFLRKHSLDGATPD